jgi:hypothetical protein
VSVSWTGLAKMADWLPLKRKGIIIVLHCTTLMEVASVSFLWCDTKCQEPAFSDAGIDPTNELSMLLYWCEGKIRCFPCA